MKRQNLSVSAKFVCFVSQTCTVSVYGVGFYISARFFFFCWVKTFKILFFEIFFYETLENFSGRQFLIALSVKHVLLVSLASVFVFLSGFFCFVKTIKNSFFMKR